LGAYAASTVTEARLYLIGSAVAFIGLSVWVLSGWSWWAAAVLLVGLVAVGAGIRTTSRRTLRVRVEIEDEHLRPVPVLDAPKGTYDLISGLTVRVENRTDEPVGVKIDTLLYFRNSWKWDSRVAGGQPVPLLTPSVVAGRRSKSFFVKNYTRIPAEIEELTPGYFVKLIVETSDGNKSVHRAFVAERFDLPRNIVPKPRPISSESGHPLLPFEEDLAAATAAAEREHANIPLGQPASSLSGREARARRLRNNGEEAPDVVRIDLLKKPNDSLEGLIDELELELEAEPESSRPTDGEGHLHN
jgi:hypothetical protein